VEEADVRFAILRREAASASLNREAAYWILAAMNQADCVEPRRRLRLNPDPACTMLELILSVFPEASAQSSPANEARIKKLGIQISVLNRRAGSVTRHDRIRVGVKLLASDDSMKSRSTLCSSRPLSPIVGMLFDSGTSWGPVMAAGFGEPYLRWQ
jgi:hypothetical protein